jgi:hypothetical protein
MLSPVDEYRVAGHGLGHAEAEPGVVYQAGSDFHL